jgi:hypothetical protein
VNLVDSFTEHPETLVVCDKRGDSTALSRLSRSDMERWKEKGLAQLWLSGRIGGTRW